MRILDRFILSTVLPIFFLSILFFVLLLQLVDVFSNLNRFLSYEVPFELILRIQMLFVPKAVQYALPIALLFSIAYAMGTLHAQNELISVFSSGVSLSRFVVPLLVFGVLAGGFSFWFEDALVIPTLREKNQLTSQVLRYSSGQNNPNVTRFDQSGKIVYNASLYTESTKELTRPGVFIRDDEGKLVLRVQAETATWDQSNDQWAFRNAWVYEFPDEERVVSVRFENYTNPLLSKNPQDFRRTERNVEDMKLEEAERWIESLRASGVPARREETLYQERFSFALTPLIVGMLSIPIGGRFKKNILLSSLLVSLGFAVVYFVFKMIGGLLATLGYISPVVGAWAGVFVFALAGIILLRNSHT